MRIIISGGRNFDNYELLKEKCDYYLKDIKVDEIVSGTARGADMLGEQYAEEKGYEIHQYIPDWNGLGKSAGYKRNAKMADNADALIAFWDGESKGTANMIDIAKKKGLKVRVVKYVDGR